MRTDLVAGEGGTWAPKWASDAKDLLEMGNRIGLVAATNKPTLRAAASQQGTEVISVNQDADGDCQGNHFVGCLGTVELLLHPWVAVHLMAEVIQHIQKGLRASGHIAPPEIVQQYSGTSHGYPKTS